MRCKWCGEESTDEFCSLCVDKPEDRFVPHSTQNGQFIECDFDLFCSRMGIRNANLDDYTPTPEQVQSMKDAVDRIILGRLHKELKEKSDDTLDS